MNNIKELAKTIIVIMILVAGVSLVSAWTAPTLAPPAGNVAAPVNVGALSQIKTGPLQVNGFRNIGNSIFDGNVGIGTAAPTQKLDVAGDIKTNAGIWLGGVRRTTWPSGGGTVVSSGLYGWCAETYYYDSYDGTDTGSWCTSDKPPKSPAFCLGRRCACPADYTLITVYKTTMNVGSAGSHPFQVYFCYKN